MLYEHTVTEVITQPWFYPALAVLGILFVLLLIAGVRRHRHKSMRVYRDESGNASVTRKALLDLVHLACARIDMASKPKICIKPNRGRLDMTIKVKLYEGQRLNELRDRMRRSVIRTFEEGHGIRLGDINILIIGFKKGAHNPPLEVEDEEKTDTLNLQMSEEKKPEKKSVVEPDVTTVAALGTGLGTDPVVTANAPEIEPVLADEYTPPEEKKKPFFSWGRKTETPAEEGPQDNDSEDSEIEKK